jgi:hypothetical protein
MTLLTGFKKFLLRGNVVDLAVEVVVGTAFAALVKALVADLLTPIIALIFGRPKARTGAGPRPGPAPAEARRSAICWVLGYPTRRRSSGRAVPA